MFFLLEGVDPFPFPHNTSMIIPLLYTFLILRPCAGGVALLLCSNPRLNTHSDPLRPSEKQPGIGFVACVVVRVVFLVLVPRGKTKRRRKG